MNNNNFYRAHEIVENSNSFRIDVPVLILFFNRPDFLSVVFDIIRKAKPSILLLYQDGPRESCFAEDLIKIKECREIVSKIDWNCTIHRRYQENNYGCDPAGYMSRHWAFSLVEKCIILEDDVVPNVTFFSFCKEMLDRYNNDKRIYRICGQNILGKYSPYDSDYFFTKGGSIWGWATWKRVFEEWDPDYKFIDNKKVIQCLKHTYKDSAVPIDIFLKNSSIHRDSCKEYFESIYTACRYLGSGLSIVPSRNMINNIGYSKNSTHGGGNINLLPKRYQKIFYAHCYETVQPFVHPKYILEDKKYEDLQSRIMGWRRSIFRKLLDNIEEIYRSIIYKNYREF